MRADLVLLGADPTQTRDAYRDNHGVMVRGEWLSRSDLDAALAELATIEAEPDATFPISANGVHSIIDGVMRLAREHIVFDHMHMSPAVDALRKLGYVSAFESLARVMARLTEGSCAEVTPSAGND
jgi:hypothetical protein